MATRAVLTPFAAEFPATSFAALGLTNRRPTLAYDAAASEAAYWTVAAPQGLTGTLTLIISYVMASATSGNVVWRAQIEAIAASAAVDLDTTTSFDAANSVTSAVPATAGILAQATITLANADSIAVGDYVRISIDRDAANASDTAAGDALLLSAEWRDTA